MFCSDCFKNQGLRFEAKKLSDHKGGVCSRCGSAAGFHLNEDQCVELIDRFFVDGSLRVRDWMISPFRFGFGNRHNIQFDSTLEGDFQLLLLNPELGLQYRAPKTFLVGDTEHFSLFGEIIDRRKLGQPLTDQDNAVIDSVLDRCNTFTLPQGTRFFRIRKDPSNAWNI
jgi:hypothetical protein